LIPVDESFYREEVMSAIRFEDAKQYALQQLEQGISNLSSWSAYTDDVVPR
jgi:hypothetical protein